MVADPVGRWARQWWWGRDAVLAVAIALPIVLLVAHLEGQLAAARPGPAGHRHHIVLSILGISGGLVIGGLLFDDVRLCSPNLLVLTAG